jgi:hypothetical protein
MPTAKPRYTVTDTGHLAELLDTAQRHWPEIVDRKQLLLRLAEEGHQAVAAAGLARDAQEHSDRVVRALARIPALVDTDLVLADRAWE